MRLYNIEFLGTFSGDVEIRCFNATPYVLQQNHRDFITFFLDIIQARWSEAYNYFSKLYQKYAGNIVYYEFLIVRGFIKCNFSNYDGIPDIDSEGNFHFEMFFCPRFGECPGHRIACCFPRETTSLSLREIEVLEFIAKGYTAEQIGDILCRSKKTIHNHTNHILSKTDKKNNAALSSYYYTHIKTPI